MRWFRVGDLGDRQSGGGGDGRGGHDNGLGPGGLWLSPSELGSGGRRRFWSGFGRGSEGAVSVRICENWLGGARSYRIGSSALGSDWARAGDVGASAAATAGGPVSGRVDVDSGLAGTDVGAVATATASVGAGVGSGAVGDGVATGSGADGTAAAPGVPKSCTT